MHLAREKERCADRAVWKEGKDEQHKEREDDGRSRGLGEEAASSVCCRLMGPCLEIVLSLLEAR